MWLKVVEAVCYRKTKNHFLGKNKQTNRRHQPNCTTVILQKSAIISLLISLVRFFSPSIKNMFIKPFSKCFNESVIRSLLSGFLMHVWVVELVVMLLKLNSDLMVHLLLLCMTSAHWLHTIHESLLFCISKDDPGGHLQKYFVMMKRNIFHPILFVPSVISQLPFLYVV